MYSKIFAVILTGTFLTCGLQSQDKAGISDELPVYDTTEIMCKNEGKSIYGIAYIPNTNDGNFPLVIYAHGLGGSYQSGLNYTRMLASHGIAVYTFDFRGGDVNDETARSIGKFLGADMVITGELTDLGVLPSDERDQPRTGGLGQRTRLIVRRDQVAQSMITALAKQQTLRGVSTYGVSIHGKHG
jgi:dienelactone hydrolase